MTDNVAALRGELVELQSQLAFQEDTINQLNAALAAQQQDLSELKRNWRLLREEFSRVRSQWGEEGEAADDRPPHY